MKIAVITRMLRKDKLKDFGMFTDDILLRLVNNDPEHEFCFSFSQKI